MSMRKREYRDKRRNAKMTGERVQLFPAAILLLLLLTGLAAAENRLAVLLGQKPGALEQELAERGGGHRRPGAAL